MIDIIIRDCGYGEWLPLINTMHGKELYRGDRLPSYKAACLQAKVAWDENLTGNIIEYKEKNPQGRAQV